MFSKDKKDKVEKNDRNKYINQDEKESRCEEKEQQVKEELKNKKCDKQDKKECKQKDENLERIKELEETLEFKQKILDNEKNEKYKLSNQVDTLKDRLQRISSEYENYRNRTAKEKEALYNDACEDIFKNIFPVMDNLERAANIEGNADDIKKGVEMTLKQFKDSLNSLGIEEISTEGIFDPNFHNAVMHVEDDNYEEKQIVDVLQKGYKKGNKVLRYSMVKVAN